MARVGTLGIHHLEDVGIHYALTLRRWRESFFGNLDRVRTLGFDQRFIRMWDYYLATCEAAFETRTLGNLAARPHPGPEPSAPRHPGRGRGGGMTGFRRRRIADPVRACSHRSERSWIHSSVGGRGVLGCGAAPEPAATTASEAGFTPA